MAKDDHFFCAACDRRFPSPGTRTESTSCGQDVEAVRSRCGELGALSHIPHRQLLPEVLAQMPPGPRIGAALAEIDPARLVAIDAEVYMRACYRQVSYEQARFMEAMVWFGLCRPAPDEVVAHDTVPSPAASDGVRASLRWTRQTAERQFYLALDLQDRLPHVFQALWEGRIDLPRARVLAEWTQGLTPEHRTQHRFLSATDGRTVADVSNLRRFAVIPSEADVRVSARLGRLGRLQEQPSHHRGGDLLRVGGLEAGDRLRTRS